MSTDSKPIKYRELLDTSDEYKTVVEYLTLSGTQPLPKGYKLQFIEAIDNPVLTKRYNECPLEGERIMFHGTDPNNIESIEQNGLLIDKARRWMYGVGNYASPYATTAMAYMQKKYEYFNMYCLSVKLGKFGTKENGGNHYGNGHDIYVLFDESQINLKYRIGFEID